MSEGILRGEWEICADCSVISKDQQCDSVLDCCRFFGDGSLEGGWGDFVTLALINTPSLRPRPFRWFGMDGWMEDITSRRVGFSCKTS